jgi:hypothetical protein
MLEKRLADLETEFTEHQRSVFCVFSGQGVLGLRRYLNGLNHTGLTNPYDEMPAPQRAPAGPALDPDGTFDDAEADGVDDDDALDGSEMVIDAQPLLGQVQVHGGQHATAIPPPPPLHTLPGHNAVLMPVNPAGYIGPVQQVVRFPEDPQAFAQIIQPRSLAWDDELDTDRAGTLGGQASRSWATVAAAGPSSQHSARNRGASAATTVGNGAASEASTGGGSRHRRAREASPYLEDAEVSSGSGTPDEA